MRVKVLPGLFSFCEVPQQGPVTCDLTSFPSRKPSQLRPEPDSGPQGFVTQRSVYTH